MSKLIERTCLTCYYGNVPLNLGTRCSSCIRGKKDSYKKGKEIKPRINFVQTDDNIEED